jgi:hypothetical protein
MLVVLVNDFNAFYCLLVMVWWGVLLFAMQGIGCLAGYKRGRQGLFTAASE